MEAHDKNWVPFCAQLGFCAEPKYLQCLHTDTLFEVEYKVDLITRNSQYQNGILRRGGG